MSDSRSHLWSRVPGVAAWLALAWLGVAVIAGAAGATEADGVDFAFLPAPGTRPARVTRRVAPVYPLEARREGIAGTVIVWARVGRDGRVRETRVEHSIAALDAQAQAAAGRYEFAPATRGDGPVESWVELPVRFDESLPIGARGGDPIDVAPYDDLVRGFESEVAVFQESDPAMPSVDDVEQRERIGRAALALAMIPPPSEEAVHAFALGDSLANTTADPSRARRKEAWARASYLAPWWIPPYRRLVASAIADKNYGGALATTRAWLAARPGDPEAEALMRRATQLRLAITRRRANEAAEDDKSH